MVTLGAYIFEGHAAYSGEGELEECCLDSPEPHAAADKDKQTHEGGVAVKNNTAPAVRGSADHQTLNGMCTSA